MGEINILVLGVGSNVSQGILKALSLSEIPHRVIGACIDPLSPGLYTVDRAYISPPAVDPSFVDWIIKICRTEHIKAILSGVEPVLSVMSRNSEKIFDQTGAICIVSSPEILSIANDKMLTCQWLKERGFNYPRYAVSDDDNALKRLIKECGYPLIAKLRSGRGSQGIIEIHDLYDLKYISRKPGYVIQEFLGNTDSEYTVGCFSDHNGLVRGTIAMHRELLQGTTYRAEVGDFPEIRYEASRIVSALKPMGPSNVQMRISNGKPVCFEINVRFSGTTPMRARLGFNDVEATLKHYVLGMDAEDLPLITKGIALRYWNEIYVDERALNSLNEHGIINSPNEFNLLIEDYGKRS